MNGRMQVFPAVHYIVSTVVLLILPVSGHNVMASVCVF